MISDVLSDALDQIEEYQGSFPHAYEDTRDQIEEVKLAMTRLMIIFDTPPGMTTELWIEGMVRLAETDPARLKELMKGRVYPVKRNLVTEALGQDNPMLARLLKAEQEAERDEESDLAEALEAYTEPTHPDYDPDFDREIRSLRPDWFANDKHD